MLRVTKGMATIITDRDFQEIMKRHHVGNIVVVTHQEIAPAYNRQCNGCGLRGHLKASTVCRFNNTYSNRGYRARGRPNNRGRGRGGRNYSTYNRRVHYAGTDGDSVENENLGEMFEQCVNVQDVFSTKTSARNDPDWNVNLVLEIESGAMCNVLSMETAERFEKFSSISSSDIIINGLSGKQIKSSGKITLPCNYKGLKRDIMFQVIDTPRNVNLLGREDSVNFVRKTYLVVSMT